MSSCICFLVTLFSSSNPLLSRLLCAHLQLMSILQLLLHSGGNILSAHGNGAQVSNQMMIIIVCLLDLSDCIIVLIISVRDILSCYSHNLLDESLVFLTRFSHCGYCWYIWMKGTLMFLIISQCPQHLVAFMRHFPPSLTFPSPHRPSSSKWS